MIGSKKFTESYVLGEIAKRALSDAGIPAEHRQGMGGTIILWEALRTGQIDAYPEYTGTITEEILKDRQATSPEAIREALRKSGVGITKIARIQQHLRARHATGQSARARRAHDQRLAKSARTKDRPDARIFGSTRWLAAARGALPAKSAEHHRHRSRAWLCRAQEWLDRREGCLLDRRQDCRIRSRDARRRSPIFPAL